MSGRASRLRSALRAHWLAIVAGAATGVYLAFAASLGFLLVEAAYGLQLDPADLASVMQAFLLVGMIGGGLLGYRRRRSP